MLKDTVTSFISSRESKQLSTRRVLFHLPERVRGYDQSSERIIQNILSPVTVALCPTCYCVRSCTFCSNAERNRINRQKKAKYSSRIFSSIAEDLKSMGVLGVTLAGGGEPLAYDDAAIRSLLTDPQAQYRVGIHTNGVLLNQILEGNVLECGKLRYANVSVVAHTPQLYAHVARAEEEQFHLIERNLQAGIRLEKDYPAFSFGVKILVCRENYRHVEAIKSYFMALGISDILIRCVGNFEPGQDVELQDAQRQELAQVFQDRLNMSKEQTKAVIGRSDVQLPKPSRCWITALQFTAGIDPDGEVYLCSPWSRPGYSIGNVNCTNLQNMWGSDRHKQVAERLNTHLQKGECNPLTCRHYYSNLAIDAFLQGVLSTPSKDTFEAQYGRFL